jgi:hypothetical protein
MMRKHSKSRLAKVLFVKDSPFKPRLVKSKKTYTRKAKHRVKN